MFAKSIAYKKRLYNFVSSVLPDRIFRPNIKCVFFLFSVCKTKKEEEKVKQGVQLLLICFPEVIKRSRVHHAFLIIDINFQTFEAQLPSP